MNYRKLLVEPLNSHAEFVNYGSKRRGRLGRIKVMSLRGKEEILCQ